MNRSPALEDLLLDWEERLEQGHRLTPEDLCTTRSDLLPELRRQIRLLESVSSLASFGQVDSSSPEIPGFDILEEVGRGGMGIVYRAWDRTLRRTVAIKVPTGNPALGPFRGERFIREAQLLAPLQHPHIVRLHSANLVAGQPYLIMDFQGGGNLSKHKERYLRNPAAAVALLEWVADAVGYAHSQKVLHRDLKPANILLDEKNRPYVTDFGIAAILQDSSAKAGGEEPWEAMVAPGSAHSSRLTRTGTALGTPAYMAPEQSVPHQPVGPQADVWALGVILYEIVTGQLPFPPPDRLAPDHQGRTDLLRFPRTGSMQFDRGLQKIISKCLAEVPESRYPTAAELAADLAAWRQRPRWRWAKAMVAAGAVLGLVVLAALFGPKPSDPVPADPEDAYQKQIRVHLDALDRGDRIELIPGQGPPRGFRPRTSLAIPPTIQSAENGCFQVSAPKLTLLELLPDSRTEHFRFSADIRQDDHDGAGEVGLYYAYHRSATESDDLHFHGVVRFADMGPQVRFAPDGLGTRTSRIFQDYAIYHERPNRRGRIMKTGGPNVAYPVPPTQFLALGHWRRLVIEINPVVVQTRFDKVHLPRHDQPFINQSFLKIMPMHEPVLQINTLGVQYRGGLGLYLDGTTATFRNCQLEPLDKP